MAPQKRFYENLHILRIFSTNQTTQEKTLVLFKYQNDEKNPWKPCIKISQSTSSQTFYAEA